jgi:S1-C subfamily serine protease
MLKRFLTFFALPLFIPSQVVLAAQPQPTLNQQLTMYAKPAVVRIILRCTAVYNDKRNAKQPQYFSYVYGWNESNKPDAETAVNSYKVGTGFIIGSDGYIVTNAHMVDHATKGREDCRKQMRRNLGEDLQIAKAADVSALIDGDQMITESLYYDQHVYLPNASKDSKADFFPFEVKQSGTVDENGNGKDVAIIKIEVKNAPILRLANSAAPKLQAPIIVIGYPGVADVAPAQDAASLMEATVTEGIVSNPNKILPDLSPIIQVDVRVAPGSSGSPVLNQDGEVIGVIAFQQQDDQENKIPFAVPVVTIQQFVGPSGAVNKAGDTDSRYREGLALYWRSEFEPAKKNFESVTSLFPQHSEANRLIQESNEEIAKTVSSQDYVPWLAGVAIALLGMLGAYFIVRRRSTPSFAGVGAGEHNFGDRPETAGEHQQNRSDQVEPPKNRTVMSPSPRGKDTVLSMTWAVLELKNSEGQPQRFELKNDQHRLGRDRQWADFRVPETGWDVLSKRHAILKRESNSYRIYDGDGVNSSTNGVLVNGTRVSPGGSLLNNGDQIQIGEDYNQVTGIYQSEDSKRTTPQPGSNSSYRDSHQDGHS